MTMTSIILLVFLIGIFAILTVGGLLAWVIDARIDHGDH